MFILRLAAFCALFAITCLSLQSCDFFWKDKPPVIAEVDDVYLSVEELKESSFGDSVSKAEWVSRVEHWVDFEVMYREALKRGLQKDPDVKKLIKDAERKILVDRLRMSIGDVTETESIDEMHEYYEKNKEELFTIEFENTVEFLPFSDVRSQIKSMILSEKRLEKEKEWLNEIKNNYSIDVYPQYLDSL